MWLNVSFGRDCFAVDESRLAKARNEFANAPRRHIDRWASADFEVDRRATVGDGALVAEPFAAFSDYQISATMATTYVSCIRINGRPILPPLVNYSKSKRLLCLPESTFMLLVAQFLKNLLLWELILQ